LFRWALGGGLALFSARGGGPPPGFFSNTRGEPAAPLAKIAGVVLPPAEVAV
jgi:hypothetical protein